MTTDEIFSQIGAHMIEGLMIHSQLSDYFGFLGFEGYQECHKYHYFEENCNYKKLSKYYLKHYNKLLIEKPFKNPNIIPSDWWQFTREQVNNDIRKRGVQIGIEKWISWEKQTKELYEKYYNELIQEDNVAGAQELSHYIVDVDYELAEAEQENIKLKAMDYSVLDIMLEQENKKEKYINKIKEIALC